jgi:hypothetical protein
VIHASTITHRPPDGHQFVPSETGFNDKRDIMVAKAARRPSVTPLPTLSETQRTEALLTAAGCVDCVHALVLGNGIDLVCAMVRSGCPAAVCLKQVVNMPEAEHELVLVPEPARLGTPDVVVRGVRRALKPQGRAVFGIAASPQMTLSITRRLRLNGFRNVRTTAYAGFDVVSAQIPGHRGRA